MVKVEFQDGSVRDIVLADLDIDDIVHVKRPKGQKKPTKSLPDVIKEALPPVNATAPDAVQPKMTTTSDKMTAEIGADGSVNIGADANLESVEA